MHNPYSLNTQQTEAVEAKEKAVLVVAGAGSGKTSVATFRIAKWIQDGIESGAILGLTFTNKAALEMRLRVVGLVQRDVLVTTFHSLGARVLRESIHHLGYTRNFSIYNEEESTKLLKECLLSLGLPSAKSDLAKLSYGVSRAKNALLSFEQVEGESKELAAVYRLYQEKLRVYGAVDFDDLLFLPVQLWQQHPDVLVYYQNRWTHFLVDEYQDTNHAQYVMTRLLVGEKGYVFVVGDPDQLIYSWRGANIRNILRFSEDYPGARLIALNQNYRSTETILEASNALIQCNTARYEKALWSHLGVGEKIKVFWAEGERQEAAFVVSQIERLAKTTPYTQIAVFFRTHAQSLSLEDQFLLKNIPYKMVGGVSFYQRREIRDVLAILRLVASDTDVIAFKRAIQTPKRGMGETSLDRLVESAERDGVPIVPYSRHVLEEMGDVKLTAPAKKGLGQFLQMLFGLRQAARTISLGDLIKQAIEESGYVQFLQQDKETYEERKENVYALVSKAIVWKGEGESLIAADALQPFLEELSLKTSLDEAQQEGQAIQLMTIHNSKGLEFEVVFLSGLEEDLFPHVNSRGELDKVEEERRLCYVGMTRAKRVLFLSCCRTRFLWGTLRSQRPSRFLREIPQKYFEVVRSSF